VPEEINTDYFAFEPRITQPRLLVDERSRSFAEIDLKISAGLAMREAGRCFNCGICYGCDNCYLFCPDVSMPADGMGRTAGSLRLLQSVRALRGGVSPQRHDTGGES
jgi:hypothetical protein